MSIETFTPRPDVPVLAARMEALKQDDRDLVAIAALYYQGINRVRTNTTITAAEEAAAAARVKAEARKEPEHKQTPPPATDLQYMIGYLASRRAIEEAKEAGSPARYLEYYDRIAGELSALPAELVDKHYQHDLGFSGAPQAE